MGFTVYLCGETGEELYCRHMTYNICEMMAACGVYECIRKPNANRITKAAQMIWPLTDGIIKLATNKAEFMPFNPPNGWGSYDGLLIYLAEYLVACKANPNANVSCGDETT